MLALKGRRLSKVLFLECVGFTPIYAVTLMQCSQDDGNIWLSIVGRTPSSKLNPSRLSVYKIIDIPPEAAESSEQLGTKFKFWYSDKDYGHSLFKEGRPATGENCAEKIACELAELLGMPHAQYEFAQYKDKQGVISPILVTRGERLIHGNELLATFETDYGTNQAKPYRQKEHTIRRVLGYFRGSVDFVGAPSGFVQTKEISTALDVFVGYLMFDAWIANQDRHDQNWGLIRTSDGNSFLAPSYDHGSSMGRNETDAKREIMLTTNDQGQHISKYVATARSALYPQTPADIRVKALLTLDAFEQAARQSPRAANAWRDRLASLNEKQVTAIIEGVPQNLMTDTAKRFTLKLLELNRARILNCEL